MKQLILFLLCLSTWTAQAKIYNVKDYGAKADGTTIDTPAINRAIEEAASQGEEPFISLRENTPAIPYVWPAIYICI